MTLSPFDMARIAANAAMYIDEQMPGIPRKEALGHVEALHDIAEQLAGNRLTEIYDKENSMPRLPCSRRRNPLATLLRRIGLTRFYRSLGNPWAVAWEMSGRTL